MICEEETDAEGVFSTIKEIHRKSFKDIGGEYVERGGKEKTCAIRLAQTAFFEVRFGLAFMDVMMSTLTHARATNRRHRCLLLCQSYVFYNCNLQ